MNNNLEGKIFGSLLVIKKVEAPLNYKAKRNSFWLCKCQKCGEEKIRTGLKLRNMKTCICEYKGLNSKYKKFNRYNLSGKYGIGYMYDDIPFYFDLEDYEKIKNYSWTLSGNRLYIVTNDYITHKKIMLHYLVYGSKIHEIGFKNKNHLDVRKTNLRIGKRKEHLRNRKKSKNNTSGITGVHWCKRDEKWISTITVNYKFIYLGSHKNLEEAVRVRLKGEKEYFKEFAPQRHLFKQYGIED